MAKNLEYAALNSLKFGHLGMNKVCNDATMVPKDADRFYLFESKAMTGSDV